MSNSFGTSGNDVSSSHFAYSVISLSGIYLLVSDALFCNVESSYQPRNLKPSLVGVGKVISLLLYFETKVCAVCSIIVVLSSTLVEFLYQPSNTSLITSLSLYSPSGIVLYSYVTVYFFSIIGRFLYVVFLANVI